MSNTFYWVVGGKFRSLNFHTLVNGTQEVDGPFPTRREAEEAWRIRSEKHRHECNTRFTIVQEKVQLGGRQRAGASAGR
jgi:hypothetical protein